MILVKVSNEYVLKALLYPDLQMYSKLNFILCT